MLRIDLIQSTAFRLAEPAYLREVLPLMQREPAAGLPVDVALELAQREGLKAVLTGEVGRLGGSYIITAQLLVAENGTALAVFKQVARDSTQLIGALDALSKQIRSKIGESLKSVRASEPLWRISTASLPALRRYGEALAEESRSGNPLRVIGLLEEAIALDSMFAGAYRKVAVTLENQGVRRRDMLAHMTRAYELRHRLPERERHNVVASYYSTVRGDNTRAIEAYRAALALDPYDWIASNNLPFALGRQRRYAEAAEILEQAIRSMPAVSRLHFTNLAIYQYALGRFDDAEATLAEAARRMPMNIAVQGQRARLTARGDYTKLDSLLAHIGFPLSGADRAVRDKPRAWTRAAA